MSDAETRPEERPEERPEDRAGSDRSKELRCPFCHDRVGAANDHGECVECRAVMHLACFEEHEGCAILGCQCRTLRLPDERRVMWLNGHLVPVDANPAPGSSGCRRTVVVSLVVHIPLLLALWLLGQDPVSVAFTGVILYVPMLILVGLALELGNTEGDEEQRRRVQEQLEQEDGVTVGAPSMWHDIMGQSGFDPIFGTGGPPRLPRSFVETAERLRTDNPGAFAEDSEELDDEESSEGPLASPEPESAPPEPPRIKACELRPEDQRVEDGTS